MWWPLIPCIIYSRCCSLIFVVPGEFEHLQMCKCETVKSRSIPHGVLVARAAFLLCIVIAIEVESHDNQLLSQIYERK